MEKILIVEDDQSIVENLIKLLNQEGYGTDSCSGQACALEKVENNKYDLILLDIFLSDGNGYSVCTAIKNKYTIPIIFLTASSDEYSTVTGFDIGADDYIAKPFRPRELISRIKNVLRRYNKKSLINLGDLTIDSEKAIVLKNGNEIFLSALEYRLLLLFANNKNITLTRQKILDDLFDVSGEFINDNTLTVYIKRLREKIEDDPQEPKIIITQRGIGYRVEQ